MSPGWSERRGVLRLHYDRELLGDPPALLFRSPRDFAPEAGFLRVHASRGAEVFRGELVPGRGTVYWKEFRSRRSSDRLKDGLRRSRARRAFLGGEQMERLGFTVPRVLAFGEERVGPWLRRCFLVTEELTGFIGLVQRADPEGFARIGTRIAQLHGAGFVHGDLKDSNVMLEVGGAGVALLDNERSRPCTARREQVRNIVQLFVEPEVDRRGGGRSVFLEHYLSARGDSLEDPDGLVREVDRWIEQRRARRAARARGA